ncbi:Gll1812 protein [hydrothermal vent metagenome]|uniref:Gll1812 protein n=1 Tax=hydrothermal vent metagenome TaxID=652676 RepID=A0A3B0TE31_9ZZZZ
MDNKPALRQKGRYQLQYRGTECSNCGHPLDISDKFCPNCSQANSTKKLGLKDFFDEFFSSIISYDSKLLKTLSALLLRPGKITRDYINGKRISYTNPFRFLLSLAIIYFLILNIGSDFSELDRFGKGRDNSRFGPNGAFSFSFSLDSYGVENEDDEAFIKTLDSIQIGQKIADALKKRDSLILIDPAGYFKKLEGKSLWGRFTKKREFFSALMRKQKISDIAEVYSKYDIGESYTNRFSFNAAKSFLKFQRRPGSFMSSLISKMPFALFFLLPFFTLFIWLAYIRKKHNYTDHLIFSFHNTSLLFILLIISSLIDSAFNINSGWFFLIVFLIYLFWAMRKFYHQSIFKTMGKFLFLNGIFFTLAITAMLIFSMGSVFTY